MIMGNPSYFEFLLTAFIWRMSPGEMQELPPEEYTLMRTWTHILIDGINGLLGAFSKDAKNPAVNNLQETAAKAGINIPNDLVPNGNNAPLSKQQSVPKPKEASSSPSSQNSKPLENINIEGLKGKNLSALKNPHVYKAMTNSVADIKFAQYEKMGLLKLCTKQRNERLNKK